MEDVIIALCILGIVASVVCAMLCSVTIERPTSRVLCIGICAIVLFLSSFGFGVITYKTSHPRPEVVTPLYMQLPSGEIVKTQIEIKR